MVFLAANCGNNRVIEEQHINDARCILSIPIISFPSYYPRGLGHLQRRDRPLKSLLLPPIGFSLL